MDLVQVAPTERQNEVQYGDIFFTTSSETPNEVGMAAVLLHELQGTYLNSFCFGMRLKSFERLSPEFAGQMLRGDRSRRSIARLAQGATRYNLSQSVIKELWIPLPSIDEQNSISAILGAVDREVELLDGKLIQLSRLKEGLMQRLLSIEFWATAD